MPVRRFRTVEDMSRAHWREAGDPDLYRTMARLWAFGQRSGVHHFPPGVYRSRSMEEVNERSDQWNEANFHAFVDARHRSRATGPAERSAR
jgi:hypothetical protein